MNIRRPSRNTSKLIFWSLLFEVNFQRNLIIIPAFFSNESKHIFYCTFSLCLYFLWKEIGKESCSLNVCKIDQRTRQPRVFIRLNDPSKIPIRATLFSSVVMVAYLMLAILISQIINDLVPKTISALFVAVLINVLRSPLTALLIFKSNVQNGNVSQTINV